MCSLGSNERRGNFGPGLGRGTERRREAWELAVAKLEPCFHVPLGEVVARVEEIPRNVPVYVLCHGGVRSGRAVEFLRGAGFGQAKNVHGGIAAWSAEVDDKVPTY